MIQPTLRNPSASTSVRLDDQCRDRDCDIAGEHKVPLNLRRRRIRSRPPPASADPRGAGMSGRPVQALLDLVRWGSRSSLMPPMPFGAHSAQRNPERSLVTGYDRLA